MRINEVDNPVTQVQLDALENALDRVFAKVGIDVEFTRHFLARVNDERNVKQITMSELGQLFKKEFVRYGKPIAQLGPDAQAVMKDLASDINIPFVLDWNKQTQMLELIAKTVMRKKNFSTSNKEFAVEDGYKSLFKPSAYELAAKRLHSVLQRKEKENGGSFRHALGWYAAKIANGFRDIDSRELSAYYQKNFDAVLSEVETKKFSAPVLNEGGAMPGVGAIHIDEIEPTLAKLEKALGLDLRNFVLGSVGKRQFSGDIDVALNLDTKDIPAFVGKLKKTKEIEDIAQSSVIMTKVKIENFNAEQNDGRPRTGYVQVDFMPGDPGWLKTYYHSPREEESKYKGVFRNLMIASIAGNFDRDDSEAKIADGRPEVSTRYMWSPANGLVKVKRTPAMNKAGTGYTKKNKNEIISGPFKTADEIANALNVEAKDLNSFETLLDAIKKTYSPEMVKRIVDDFRSNPTVQDIGVPAELEN